MRDTKPCIICSSETTCRMNIKFKQISICDPCSSAIAGQQVVFWATHSNKLFDQVQIARDNALEAVKKQLTPEDVDLIKCPNCASNLLVQIAQHVDLFQCDECGNEYPLEDLK